MAQKFKRPVADIATKGAIMAESGLNFGPGLWLFTGAGAPTAGTSGDGAGWAAIGSLYIDKTNGKAYINTGTKASPTWTVVGAQS